MEHLRHPHIPSASLFFTASLAEQGSDTLVSHIDDLRQAVRRTKAEQPFHIRAMVVLPDHLHAIWTLPAGDADYRARWEAIKARFTQAVAKGTRRMSDGKGGDGSLWQRRVWEHHIRDEAEKQRLTLACWADPVKHGLVSDPFDWLHSSIHRDATRGEEPDALMNDFLSTSVDPYPARGAPEGARHQTTRLI